MGIIKRAAILALLLLLIFFLISLLLPRDVSVIRSVEFSGTASCPENMIRDFANWPQWFPAIKNGSASLHPISTARANLLLEDGTQSAIVLHPDSLAFDVSSGRQPRVVFSFFTHVRQDGLKRLNLVVTTRLGWYPWERLKGIFIEKLAGPQYEAALENIINSCAQQE